MVGQLTWLEDCDGWKQAASKSQAGQNWRSLALCQGKLNAVEALQNALGQDQRSHLQGKYFSRQLLLTSKPRQ